MQLIDPVGFARRVGAHVRYILFLVYFSARYAARTSRPIFTISKVSCVTQSTVGLILRG